MPRHGSKPAFKDRICVDFDTCKKCVIDPVQCDVFCFFWDVPPEYKQQLDDYLDKLNPKKAVIHEPIAFDNFLLLRNGTKVKWDQSRIRKKKLSYEASVQSMFYAIKMVNELKKSYEEERGWEYEWIIRTRPDITYASVLQKRFLRDGTKLYLPRAQPNSLNNDWGGYNDQFAVAKTGIIDLYASIYDNLEKIAFEICGQKFLSTEKMLKFWFAFNKIQVNRLPIRYNLTGRVKDSAFQADIKLL